MYAKDTDALAFITYDKYQNFTKPDDINILDCINELKRLNNQIKHFDMELPIVLSYKAFKYIKWTAPVNTNYCSNIYDIWKDI